MLADSNGDIAPFSSAATLALPANAALVGGVLQFQGVTFSPSLIPWGMALTNNVEVTLGTYTTPARGYQAHFHHLDADAAAASLSVPAILAMRFN